MQPKPPMDFISGSMLEGKVAIISGIGPGMGRDITLTLAHQGADVVLAARTPEKLEALRDEVEAIGRRALCVPTNLLERAQTDALVEATISEFGQIHILVNNAFHGGDMTEFLQADLDRWRKTTEVNLFGTLQLTQAVAAHMAETAATPPGSGGDAGRIVMINSQSTVRIEKKFGAYTASKAGLAAVTKTLALELGPYGIRVNSVFPGYIWGQSQEWYFNHLAEQAGISFEEQYDSIAEQAALRYLPHSTEIAGTVLYLVSDLSLPVTGQSIHVNGGMWFH